MQYVRNITDIDDKLINRARETNVTVPELANRFIQCLHEDERRLKVITPDREPQVSQHIHAIIQMIEKLIAEGYAYVSSAHNVYYRVERFLAYGKLAHQTLGELAQGAPRIEHNSDKSNPLDFALWKAAKDNEPSWQSPWGLGRPGWHIECSAMAKYCLGDTMDIHGGGVDLQFPHHQNELAQSEAANGKTLANYWMHVGFVQLADDKMSKSTGKVVWLHDALDRFDAEVLRFWVLNSHYQSALSFTENNLIQAENSLRRLYLALRDLDEPVDLAIKSENTLDPSGWEALLSDPLIGTFAAPFQAALADNLNTPEALAVLFNLAKAANQVKRSDQASYILLAKGLKTLAGVLGLLQQPPAKFLQSHVDSDWVNNYLLERDQARRARNYQLADKIRDTLKAKGIELEDQGDGTTKWFYVGVNDDGGTSDEN